MTFRAAVGPSLGGSLMDSLGYEKASSIVLLMQIVMVRALICLLQPVYDC